MITTFLRSERAMNFDQIESCETDSVDVVGGAKMKYRMHFSSVLIHKNGLPQNALA